MKHRLASVCAPLVAAVVLFIGTAPYGNPDNDDLPGLALWAILDEPLPLLLSLLALIPALAAAFDRPRAHESDKLLQTQRMRRALPALAVAWVLALAGEIAGRMISVDSEWRALLWALPWSVLFAVLVGAGKYLRAIVAVAAAGAFALFVGSSAERAAFVLAAGGALALIRMLVVDAPAPARTAEVKAAHMPGPLVAAALAVALVEALLRAADLRRWLAHIGGLGFCDGTDASFALLLALALASSFLVAIVASFAKASLLWAGAVLPWMWIQIGLYQLRFDTFVEDGDTWCFAAPQPAVRDFLVHLASLLHNNAGGAQWALAGTSLPLVALAVLRWRARAYTPLAVLALLLLAARSAVLALTHGEARADAAEFVLFALALVLLAIPGRRSE